jgi:predicted ATPase
VSRLADEPLRFDAPVTFFVGENGSGKSTLLEAIAIAARSITVGTAQAVSDPSLSPVRQLADQLRLSWGKRTHRGFFMRAEDFFGFARGMQTLRDELIQQLREIEADQTLSEAARAYAAMPFASQLAGLSQSYGEGLDTRSHGEAFLTLFQDRLVPDGFYLLDEPEAPLSPRRQLSLLAMLRDAVDYAGAQFVIATHSPILMAYPGAAIFAFDELGLSAVPYAEVDHVAITRDFLANPELFLRHL